MFLIPSTYLPRNLTSTLSMMLENMIFIFMFINSYYLKCYVHKNFYHNLQIWYFLQSYSIFNQIIMGDQINCLIFYIPSNKLFYSVINFYICSSCSTLTFSGILSLLGSFIFNYKLPLNLTISYNFLLSLASYFLASMCVPS